MNIDIGFITPLNGVSRAIDFDQGYDRGIKGLTPQQINNKQYVKGYRLGVKCRESKNG